MLTIQNNTVVSGKEGECYLNYKDADGTACRKDFAQVSKIELKIEFEKTEFNALGRRNKLHRQTGWKGTGSATFKYNSSGLRMMADQYNKTGVLPMFDVQIINLDPQSAMVVGSQEVWAKNCILDSLILAKLDVESDIMDEDIGFTFDDFEIKDTFTNKNNANAFV
ncbi:MAG: phage tail tube protein [Oscillospiraceae bacterium]|nr:phage tail tube protein [Oscillospiraceae bacterium]